MNLRSHSRTASLALLAGSAVMGCGAEDRVEAVGKTHDALAAGTTLVGEQSKRCLDVEAASSTPGAALQIYGCHGRANQVFAFSAAGELRTFGETRCVQPASDPAGNGARAVIANCTGQPFQRWTRNANGTVVHQTSGLCLDVEGERTADKTHVILWTCHGKANQRWAPDTTPPTPPSGLVTSNVTCNTATLSWTRATDDVGVAFYDIFHDGQLMKSVDGATLSTSLTVVAGASWGLYVNARDAAGNVSQASETLPITPPPCQVDTEPPTTPTNLGGTPTGTSVTLGWSAATDNIAVTAYDIQRNGTRVGVVAAAGGSPPATTFVDTGLAPNTAYTYSVVARDAQGNVSPASTSFTVTTGDACSTPVCGVSQVATDTDVPWGLVPLPDGTVLYSRRDAQNIVLLNPSNGSKTSVGTVPGVQGTDGEGGLMGLAIGPDFASDHWLYIMHTTATDNRVVRMKLVNGALDTSTSQVLVQGILRNKYHNGGRLRVGPDGKLYVSTGDAQNGAYAQDKAGLNGKILRVNLDGSVPSDNPFGNAVWSYGHRNPQGLAFDSQGRLWEQEFGNSTMDETNLIQRGGNYGWPNCEGTTSQGGQGCATPGYLAPKRTYSTAEGSCSGIAIVRDVLYVACQRGTRLYREVIQGDAIGDVQQFFVGTYGRLRTVEPSVDGNLWMTTTNSGDKDSTPDNSNEKIFRVLLGR